MNTTLRHFAFALASAIAAAGAVQPVAAEDALSPKDALQGAWTLKIGEADGNGRIAEPEAVREVRFSDSYRVSGGDAEKVEYARVDGKVLVIGPDGKGKAYEAMSSDRLLARGSDRDRVLVRDAPDRPFELSGKWHPEPMGTERLRGNEKAQCASASLTFDDKGGLTIRYDGRVQSIGECAVETGRMSCTFRGARGELVAELERVREGVVNVRTEKPENGVTLVRCGSG